MIQFLFLAAMASAQQQSVMPIANMQSSTARQGIQKSLDDKFSIEGGTITGSIQVSTISEITELCFKNSTCQTAPASSNSSSGASTGTLCALVPGNLISSGSALSGMFFPLTTTFNGTMNFNTRYNFGAVVMSTVATTYGFVTKYSLGLSTGQFNYDMTEMIADVSGVAANSTSGNGSTTGRCGSINWDNASTGNANIVAGSTFTIKCSFDDLLKSSATLNVYCDSYGQTSAAGTTQDAHHLNEIRWRGAGIGPPTGFVIETLQKGSAADFTCYDSTPDNGALVYVYEWELCQEGWTHQ